MLGVGVVVGVDCGTLATAGVGVDQRAASYFSSVDGHSGSEVNSCEKQYCIRSTINIGSAGNGIVGYISFVVHTSCPVERSDKFDMTVKSHLEDEGKR
jgi:hypothetical protein